MRSGALLVGALLAMNAGCAPPQPTASLPPVSTGKVRVRVFTDPSPVRMVVAAEKFVFVATGDDVERFDDGGGVFALSTTTGKSTSNVLALGPDPERKQVWILTDTGLGRYDAKTEVYSELLAPPASMNLDFAQLAKDATTSGLAIASAKDGGAWIGTSRGLFYVSAQGGWSSTPIKDPIRSLVRDQNDWVWIATTTGLMARKPSGDTVRVGGAQGMVISSPRLLVEMPGGRMLAVGTDDAGKERLAFGKEASWHTYRALPDVTWDAATKRGSGAVVMGGGRLYRIGLAQPDEVKPLVRDGMRLVGVTLGAPSEWAIDPIDVTVPPGATSLGAIDDQLLIGTRELGTARFVMSSDGRARPRDWLRRKQMFQDANSLSVACAGLEDCWIATGARQAWHWTGGRFVAGGPDQVVLAVARGESGDIYAFHRASSESVAHLSRIDKAGTWSPVGTIALQVPGSAPEISFVRVTPAGSLWVGLRYRDGVETRSYGLAIVDPAEGTVAYHRTTSERTGTKMYPIPVGLLDGDVHGDVAWFATSEGVARLEDGQIRLWTEADGLQSELARAVSIAQNGTVYVATGAGAAIWDGKEWDFPAALRFELNDVVATRNGQVWMATERGIAAWDGQKVRRVDMRRGLAENQILDVAVDQYERVWARGTGSLTLISQ